MLSYEDCGAAADWLCGAFGFEEQDRYTEPDGRVTQPGPDYQCPRRHREECEAAARWAAVPYVIDGVYVSVDDVDRHFAAAEAAGATILSGVEDTPVGRHYRAEDLEGHRWMFE